MTVGRVLLIVFGSIIALIGLALLVGGSLLLWADLSRKDDDGFFMSRTERYSTPSRAIVTENLDVGSVPGGSGRWADIRVRADGAGDRPIFVGIGPRDDVQRYLDGVPHTQINDVDLDPFRVTYQPRPGTSAPAPPAQQGFWAAQVQGSGQQTLTWGVDDGDWQIVAMNADGSPPVALDASVGVKISHVLAIAIGVLVVGLLILAGGITMIVFGARRRRAPPAPAAPADTAAPPT
jgi:hypothetical protein